MDHLDEAMETIHIFKTYWSIISLVPDAHVANESAVHRIYRTQKLYATLMLVFQACRTLRRMWLGSKLRQLFCDMCSPHCHRSCIHCYLCHSQRFHLDEWRSIRLKRNGSLPSSRHWRNESLLAICWFSVLVLRAWGTGCNSRLYEWSKKAFPEENKWLFSIGYQVGRHSQLVPSGSKLV